MQYVYYAVAILVAVVALLLLVNRPQYVQIDAPIPAAFQGTAFPHDSFEQLLREFHVSEH